MSVNFLHPEAFWLLLLLPLWAVAELLLLRPRRLRLGTSHPAKEGRQLWVASQAMLPRLLQALGLVLLIISLARPQQGVQEPALPSKGLDVLFAFDVSESMETPDLQPDRLAAAKGLALSLLEARPQDRVGLLVFAENAFLLNPLTPDLAYVREEIRRLDTKVMPNEGTALGKAIGLGALHLQQREARNRMLVVFTDGAHNLGRLDPLAAAGQAARLGVRLFTVGLGSKSYTRRTSWGGTVQEPAAYEPEVLQAAAAQTGGRFFSAQDEAALAQVRQALRQEQTQMTQALPRLRAADRATPFLLGGLLAFAIAALLALLGRANYLEGIP